MSPRINIQSDAGSDAGTFFSLYFFLNATRARLLAAYNVAIMKRHETPGCTLGRASPCSLLHSSSFFIFFPFRFQRDMRGGERISGLVVRAHPPIVARGCIIALIKRYILWTRYNSGTKPCVLLHDKGENWQACWCSCCHGWRWMGHSRSTKELRIGETRVQLIKSLCV